MSVKKAELDLPSGETIRMSIWDPKTSLMPKEIGTIQHKDRKAKRKREEGGYFTRMLSGTLFNYQSSSDEEGSSTDSEEDNSNPLVEGGVNSELAEEYLASGTYHSVVFIFDPSLTVVEG